MNTIIEFKNVYKNFKSLNVLENVNFTVNKHDIFGYIGPNGAGKTTTIRLITGLLEATRGEITVFGSSPNQNHVRSKIGFCYDNDGLYPNLTAYENMFFWDIIYNNKNGRDNRIMKFLEMVGLENACKIKISEFSRGMKKRLGLARAFIGLPELLILDEPMIGLDPEGQENIKSIINKIKAHCTIFISSHNLNDIEELCNRVAILDHHILAQGYLKDILKNDNTLVKIQLNEHLEYEQLAGLKELGVSDIEISDKNIQLNFVDKPDLNAIAGFLISRKISFKEIRTTSNNLKEKYLNLVGKEHMHNDKLS